jgi:AcrR family transcriptional regulator
VKTLDPEIYAERKASILERARQLFATNGYAETSMDDIAQACRLQKASLYHYFRSKQQLLQELVDSEHELWAGRMRDYEKGVTLRETLACIAEAFMNDMEDARRREFFKILHFESHKNPAILQAWKQSPANNRDAFLRVFAKHLPECAQTEIAIFVTQFMGALIHYTSMSKLRTENLCFAPFDDQAFTRQLVDVFCKGMNRE